MYVRKKYQRILDLSDKQFSIPSSFQKFITEKQRLHNLIIKSKGKVCTCTYCNHQFISDAKVNETIKCKNCKTKLLVKTDRLNYYIFKDNLQLLDKVEDTFILRTFELYTSYNNGTFKHNVTEFMRTLIENNKGLDFVSNQVQNHMGYMYVAHYQPRTHWRARNYRWAYRDILGIVCPHNLKSLLKNTELRYSQLDKFIKKQDDYLDFIRYFTNTARYYSFELLVKNKLYNLAKDADEFRYGKNFEEALGISKAFYPFIKKHDLTYKQLEILRLIKKEDIKLINKLTHCHCLDELNNYVDLEEAYYKVLSINKNREYEYLDYLKACVQLDYDMKDKKILYPDDLLVQHDKVMDLLEIVKNEENDKLIKERLDTLNKNIYQNKKFIVFPAPSVESILFEGKSLKHCIKTYIEKYAKSQTSIYFMRDINNQDKPLITIEVSLDNKIRQSRAFCNGAPNKDQEKFIMNWQNKILNKATT